MMPSWPVGMMALLLWGTVLALWWPGRRLWLVLLAATLAVALHAGVLRWWALVPLLAGFALYALAGRARSGPIRWLAHVLFAAWAVASALHIWPGVRNPLLLGPVRLSADSVPYTLYLNLDKTLVALVLLGCGAVLRRRAAVPGASWQLVWLLLPLAGVLVLASAAGLVAPQWKLPPWLPLWVMCNLLLTCVAEEAFFRGYLQRRLERTLGLHAGWLLASAAFGLAHMSGGALYAALAAVAGGCYGLAYRVSGRLEGAIALHFLFNLAHLVGFTYPALAPSAA
ncbi:CPBP family intramembrane metalloprotease [Chitiniphilus purpureus]|uniref:CPBP family intramembrane metalloprotease n=1 Tax=Chitiniphilus purpureus TaxID=2981137 RepID=A0ABY6DIN8_9NEIS|nr:type II CAAX endopeptidase family protein [Chitiniphilus sp. CD1]UXY14212.1 CPBP family intramembrane metalloprotease [Chitiniphilus sp. CD1]